MNRYQLVRSTRRPLLSRTAWSERPRALPSSDCSPNGYPIPNAYASSIACH